MCRVVDKRISLRSSRGKPTVCTRRKAAPRGNRTGQENSVWTCRRMPSGASGSEERSAGNPHATICGGGRWVITPSTRRQGYPERDRLPYPTIRSAARERHFLVHSFLSQISPLPPGERAKPGKRGQAWHHRHDIEKESTQCRAFHGYWPSLVWSAVWRC